PPALASLIGAMLSKEPSQRPTAAETGASLRCIGESSAIGYTPGAMPLESSDSGRGSGVLVPRTAGVLWKPWVWPAMAVALLGFAIFFGLFWPRNPRPSKLPELRSRPLTSNAGWEESPVFSPDGEAVAFRWTRKLNQPWQIYVKRLDADAPVQLTREKPGEDIGPIAWSPDGNNIAFKTAFTVDGQGGIYTIPKQGGEATRLVDLFNANFSSSIDWSPDGTQVVFSDASPATHQLAIYTFNVHTGEKRKLTSPPAADWGDWDPEFSPDGRTLAFKRVQGFWSDAIYLMPASGGPVRRVTNGSGGIWGHAWMPNGNGLIVSAQLGGSVFGLWQFPLAPGPAPVRITGGGMDAVTPASGRGAGRIAWVNRLDDTNIYRIPATGDAAPTGLIASTRRDERACYSPDGRIAFASDRSGSWEIWVARSDGSSQVRVTNFGGPLVSFPHWSPDGRHLAFEAKALGRGRIFVLECQSENARCGEAKPLTAGAGAETSTDALPSWSADGAYVYFTSNRTGRDEIWKQALAGGAALQVTRRGGYASYESRDGKWLYFSKLKPYSIWRMPGSGTAAEESAGERLLIGPPVDLTPTGWTVTSEEILFIGVSDNMPFRAIRGYRLTTGEIRTLLNLPEISERGTDLSISPDSRWLLYGQLDRSGSNIMIAETGR
ncbi:MAG: PD40 domain-containing protein, partial [Bryobacteraceae bacterium]|nr:PD40 domain-containing protein [Bryobacteraceae bacterium]